MIAAAIIFFQHPDFCGFLAGALPPPDVLQLRRAMRVKILYILGGFGPVCIYGQLQFFILMYSLRYFVHC
jgi:hypothetical protein